jgi:NADH-quinone oxidoreductase subunit D
MSAPGTSPGNNPPAAAVDRVRKLVMGQKQVADLDAEQALPPELMTVNMGPSHPAMHGTVRIVLTVDGEQVVDGDVQPGYLHRGFEKSSEAVTWTQVFPYTDRLNYISPFLNNVAYAMAVEKLMGIVVPERAEYLRVISGEISRMADHCTCVGAATMELAAFTGMLYLIEARDILWDLTEELCGARLTVAYCRVGGVVEDLPEGFEGRVQKAMDKINVLLDDADTLLTKNQIFIGRMKGVGKMTKEDAIDWGWTGPCLRSTGVPYDVRLAHPYSIYNRLDFAVPVGENGDNYDRYLVRLTELRESQKMIMQCLKQIKDTPPAIMVDDARVKIPPKQKTHTAIEELMNHFKLIIDGVQVPAGEATRTSRAPTASSASTWCPTAPVGRTSCTAARRRSCTCPPPSSCSPAT